MPSFSTLFGYSSAPKEVALSPFKVSSRENIFRGKKDEAMEGVKKLQYVDLKRDETLVLKRGYLRNYFQSKPTAAVTDVEKKRTMEYLFSMAKAACPGMHPVDIDILFGTEREKESPTISNQYLKKIVGTLLDLLNPAFMKRRFQLPLRRRLITRLLRR